MTLRTLERHLASQAVTHLNDTDNIDYFIRYFKFCQQEDRLNAKDHDDRLYGVMVDLFKHEFPNYMGK